MKDKFTRRDFLVVAGAAALALGGDSVIKKLESYGQISGVLKTPHSAVSPTPTTQPTLEPSATAIQTEPAKDILISNPFQQFGVNLAGGEFGKVPGSLFTDYIYPDKNQLDSWVSSGVLTFRVPLKIERFHNGVDLTPDANILEETLLHAEELGVSIILDAHNYGKIFDGVNEKPITIDQMYNFWGDMASRYKGLKCIKAYGLMNEPNGPIGNWPALVMAGIEAVREFDNNPSILVPGECWSSTKEWINCNPGFLEIAKNANRLKLVFEGHFYPGDSSGNFACGAPTNCGVTPDTINGGLLPFINFCRDNNVQGFIGEVGVPYRIPEWQPYLKQLLHVLKDNKIGATLWAGGPWWPDDYVMKLDPRHDNWIVQELNELNK